jgi:puromycin-sensitive aminopeptidase
MNPRNDASEYQLPRTVVPRHYVITIEPDFRTFRFSGRVAIDIEVIEPVDRVVLHALGLKITSAYVENAAGARKGARKARASVTFVDPASGDSALESFESAAAMDEKSQTAALSFDGALARGAWKLVAEYQGSLVQPGLEGFYRTTWTDGAGVQHWAASTQFEATHARRAFPCWDEPAVKATYEVTVVTTRDLSVLSNTRVASERVEGERKTVSFARTALMSTYLVAWCVGVFESSEPAFANGKELRIWSVPGKKALMAYALKCARYGVEWYERRLGVPFFGGDKIDMIAIPDFRSGAMENTGLITYRATALLVDEANATVEELQRVAEVVFHELAHMWFGNLVTMAWWDGLPLNESNATIFAYLVMADFEPEWRIFNGFALKRAAAFALDSLNSTHPCWAPVGHPDEVEQRFDRITYEKGGSLEYQMHQFIGDASFYGGAHEYLLRYSHGNAEVTDLWDALEQGARKAGLTVPVRTIMDAWFLTDGHPVITVKPTGTPGTITVSQERFAFLESGSHAGQLWPVPLQLRGVSSKGDVIARKVVFAEKELQVSLPADTQYVVANDGGSGFYRVRYAAELLDGLLRAPLERLQVVERFNLVNDAWALVRAQKMGCDEYLDLVRKLPDERDPNVWSIICASLQALHGITAGASRAAFKKLLRDLARPVFADLGWKPKQGESSAARELRGSMVALLGTVGEDPEVQSAAVGLFASWKKDRGAVEPNVVPALVSTLAYTGAQERFDEFLALSRAAPTDQEKLRFLRALGEFRVPKLFTAAIDMMLNEVKADDAPYILGAYLGIEDTGPAAWQAIRRGWDGIVKKFPSSGTVRMLAGCSALDTPELAADVQEFFAHTKVVQGEMPVAQMLERLSVNVRLRKVEGPKLAAWLARRG